MNIGLVGAGHIGGALTRKLTKLGHTVAIANSRGPASLAALATETGARAVSVTDVVKDVDLVVVTIPQKSVPLLPPGLFRDVPKGWASSTQATTTRRSVTAGSMRSRTARPRAVGWPSSWVVLS